MRLPLSVKLHTVCRLSCMKGWTATHLILPKNKRTDTGFPVSVRYLCQSLRLLIECEPCAKGGEAERHDQCKRKRGYQFHYRYLLFGRHGDVPRMLRRFFCRCLA